MCCAYANGWCLCPYASEKGWAVRWSSGIFKLELTNGISSALAGQILGAELSGSQGI